jgi:hypothetical protein
MIQYATKQPRHDENGMYYTNIYTSVGQVEMCISPGTPIYEIELTETTSPTENSYYGWSDKYDDICLVYPKFFLTNMCFPNGVHAEAAAGCGRIIRVDIKEIREVTL